VARVAGNKAGFGESRVEIEFLAELDKSFVLDDRRLSLNAFLLDGFFWLLFRLTTCCHDHD